MSTNSEGQLAAGVRRSLRPALDAASAVPGIGLWRAKRYSRAAAAGGEPELRLLGVLVRGRTFVDVGANRGTYSFFALSSGASDVIAVEPIPSLAEELRHTLGRHGVVHQIAISTRAGSQTLTIPTIDGSDRLTRATLDGDAVERGRSLVVATQPLDQLGVPADAVVKIDVEGHELEAVLSAEHLLASRGPSALLVESEERHSAGGPARLIAHLTDAGYRGWAVQSGVLIPVAEFDVHRHQADADVAVIESGGARPQAYANNFCFVRLDLADRFVTQLGQAGFRVAEQG